MNKFLRLLWPRQTFRGRWELHGAYPIFDKLGKTFVGNDYWNQFNTKPADNYVSVIGKGSFFKNYIKNMEFDSPGSHITSQFFDKKLTSRKPWFWNHSRWLERWSARSYNWNTVAMAWCVHINKGIVIKYSILSIKWPYYIFWVTFYNFVLIEVQKGVVVAKWRSGTHFLDCI